MTSHRRRSISEAEIRLVASQFITNYERKTMSDDILGSIVRALTTVPTQRLGLVLDMIRKLAGKDGATWAEESARFLRMETCWKMEGRQQTILASADRLLVHNATIAMPSIPMRFVYQDEDILCHSGSAVGRLEVRFVGKNIEEWFVEKLKYIFLFGPVTLGELHSYRLSKPSVGLAISKAFGGQEQAASTFYQVFSLIAVQRDAKIGVLDASGSHNIFYVFDWRRGSLRQIRVYRQGGFWLILAEVITCESKIETGDKIFSPAYLASETEEERPSRSVLIPPQVVSVRDLPKGFV